MHGLCLPAVEFPAIPGTGGKVRRIVACRRHSNAPNLNFYGTIISSASRRGKAHFASARLDEEDR
jgi:hypothetical protein